MTTLGIKDLYVNLPIENIINITKFWLNKNNKTMIVKQTLDHIRVIQNKIIFNTMLNILNPQKA